MVFEERAKEEDSKKQNVKNKVVCGWRGLVCECFPNRFTIP